MIYNKREYKAYIRTLYADSTVEEFENFEKDILDSGKKRKKFKKIISETIDKLAKETDESKKSILSNKLKTLIEDRSQTSSEADLYVSRFSMLGHDAKRYACTSTLLNKYLTGEIVKNNPLHFKSNIRTRLLLILKN
jgi:uncharacterized membrane-anchored protein YjiN (DUF445 family)